MAWDTTKNDNDTLTATEWNTHVTDQKLHGSRHNPDGVDPLSINSTLELARDGSNNVSIIEHTSDETVMYANRVGAGDYTVWINESGGNSQIQTASMKNIASGLAMLDANSQIPHHINKVASDNVRNSHDAVANAPLLNYFKAKEITLTNGLRGQARFKFDLQCTTPATGYGRIKRNGTFIGTEQTDTTGSYVTKSEDITQNWEAGDTCELWFHSSDGAKAVYVRNFRICYDDSPMVAVVSENTYP